jgi:hypothetical protein
MSRLYRTVYAAADTACRTAEDASHVYSHTFNDICVIATVSDIRLISFLDAHYAATAAVGVYRDIYIAVYASAKTDSVLVEDAASAVGAAFGNVALV